MLIMYYVFQSLLCALRESHKVRLMFRRNGGYLCLMSLLISLEGKLSSSVEETVPEVFFVEISNLLRFTEIIFKVLAISMRYEPSNSKYFSQEVVSCFQFYPNAHVFLCFLSAIDKFLK